MKVTIGGDPGSGKSTTARLISEELKLDYYSTGGMFRRIAHDMKISIAKLSELAEKDPRIDKRIDKWQNRLAEKEDDFVLDARLGFYFIPNSVKIALRVEPEEAAKRLMKNQRKHERYETLKQAIKSIKERKNDERERYLSKYNIDIQDDSNYDLIIDTTNLTREEVKSEILEFIT